MYIGPGIHCSHHVYSLLDGLCHKESMWSPIIIQLNVVHALKLADELTRGIVLLQVLQPHLAAS